MIMRYVTGPLVIPFFTVQFALGAVLPILVLSFIISRGVSGKAMIAGVTTCGVLVLISVFMMRWNVVIGGQEIAKTGKGLLSYHLPFWNREGAIVAIFALCMPFILLTGLSRLFPPWEDPAH
jgi:predicted membrane protein